MKTASNKTEQSKTDIYQPRREKYSLIKSVVTLSIYSYPAECEKLMNTVHSFFGRFCIYIYALEIGN